MNLEEHILIEKFLKGKLSEDEQKAFSAKREADLAFNEKVDFEETLYNSLNDDNWSFLKKPESDELDEYITLFKSDETTKLKSVLQEVNATYQNTTKKKSKIWIIYASAAVVTLLICFLVLFNKSSSHLELYASYLDTSEMPSLVSRGDESGIIRAQHFFEKGMYAEALPLFNDSITESDQPKSILSLYVGISQMELDQYEDAEKTFDMLIASNTLNASKGYWYKALLYLKANEIDKTITLLRMISSESLYNYQKANELLKELSDSDL